MRDGALAYVHPFYVERGAPEDVVALLRLGVRPTCVDAASLYGLWTPLVDGVHVFAPREGPSSERVPGRRGSPVRRRSDGSVQQTATGPLVFHRPVVQAWPDEDPVPDLTLVIDHAARCLPPRDAAVILESAVNRGAMTLIDARSLVHSLPQRARRDLARIRSDAESGTETAVRWWLESLGVKVRSQVRFPHDARRVDLLVGKSWVIECDSRAHHDDPRSYTEDRERDLYLRSLGYHVTRLTWEQVFLRWADTEAMLLRILRRGEHRRAPGR